MLSLALPSNLETDADFERAYWRVALPAGGLCAGVVGLVELWHAFGALGVVGAFGCACIAGMSALTKVDHKTPNPFDLAKPSASLLAMEDAVLEASKKRNAADFGYREALLKEHAKAQEAQPPLFYNPQAITCPYPEHGENCKVEYDAMRHQVVHHYAGEAERMSVTPLLNGVKVWSPYPSAHEPRFTVRIVS